MTKASSEITAELIDVTAVDLGELPSLVDPAQDATGRIILAWINQPPDAFAGYNAPEPVYTNGDGAEQEDL